MEHLEIRLPDETLVTLTSNDSRIDVDLRQPDFQRHYLIEHGKGWEVNDNKRFELDVDKIDEIIDMIAEMIDTTETVAGANLFDVLLWDLINERPLDWIPDGIHYFDGKLFVVFQSEDDYDQYLQGEEVGRSEYRFPRGVSYYHEYNIRKAFEEEFNDY